MCPVAPACPRTFRLAGAEKVWKGKKGPHGPELAWKETLWRGATEGVDGGGPSRGARGACGASVEGVGDGRDGSKVALNATAEEVRC